MKKKLIFDASILVTAHIVGNIYKTGLHRVTYEVLRGLIESANYDIYLYDAIGRERELRNCIAPEYKTLKVIGLDSSLYRQFVYPIFNQVDRLREKEKRALKKREKTIYRILKNSFQLLGRSFRYVERRKKKNIFVEFKSSDIYFSTYYALPENVAFIAHLQKYIIIHDLIPILHPEYFFSLENKQFLEVVVNSISENDKVICVSESTRQDFLRYRPTFNPNYVFVSHLAGADCFRPIKSKDMELRVKDKYRIVKDKDYFLSVCTIEPRKNIQLLIDAYEKLLTLTIPNIPDLVLTGAYGWKSQALLDNIERINKQFGDTILLTGFVSDEELAVLYSYTTAFVYPTLYEGFGLPSLEAMQCGAPVITSDNSSLPEVVGEAGIMINALDEEALYNALVKCMNTELIKDMREKSLLRAGLFSWNKMVNRIVAVINK